MKQIAWIPLNNLNDWDAALQRSTAIPVMIYKHSTRCGISSMVQRRLEKAWNLSPTIIEPYFLDLIAHRDISDTIARTTGIWHESPQAIILYQNNVLYHASHSEIDVSAIAQCLPV